MNCKLHSVQVLAESRKHFGSTFVKHQVVALSPYHAIGVVANEDSMKGCNDVGTPGVE